MTLTNEQIEQLLILLSYNLFVMSAILSEMLMKDIESLNRTVSEKTRQR